MGQEVRRLTGGVEDDCITICCRCVETLDPDRTSRDKILLGLNMYGFDYTSQGGGHVLGRDFVEVGFCGDIFSEVISNKA